MTAKTSTFFLADACFNTLLDRILEGICQKLQLSDTQYKLANQHYKTVGEWLDQPNTILAPFKPIIYPQGSLPMGTTNKPLGKDEYDLDFVCEFQIDYRLMSPEWLVEKLTERIGEHQGYAARMEPGSRCVRLTYAYQFHLDVVPACQNNDFGSGQICIPDKIAAGSKKSRGWKHTNSKGYLQWFKTWANQFHRQDFVEPLPHQQSLDEKPVLALAVQLFKRCRDVTYKSKPEFAPASILVSTLCAYHYQGQQSVEQAVSDILDGIFYSLKSVQGSRLQVINPANQVHEDLGEFWDDVDAYECFINWITAFREQWKQLRRMRGIQEIAKVLESMFDEQIAEKVIREMVIPAAEQRQAGKLGVTTSTGMLTINSNPIPIQRNTFFGS